VPTFRARYEISGASSILSRVRTAGAIWAAGLAGWDRRDRGRVVCALGGEMGSLCVHEG
jgi:hypothetical protein